MGHSRDDKLANEFDPRGPTTTHHHTHLAEKVNETRHHHEIEEVERVKDRTSSPCSHDAQRLALASFYKA